ncbi:transglycosylase family protein [Streptomyces sp. NPDC058989]|uniref:LysM peptidoglycan-binding domain-containing protein n=1 Tax=Streptomyces sp. NPDC058989 TaxID=3346686 RepID=UPI0036CC925F
MRSGNGRHRRPRQAPAIFVTAGVTGAGLALPLLSASGAHAADTATWDRVAQCESGGVWSAASGNGFYGGLQLTQEMWDDYGGGAYASRPDLASRAQQIAVAESILDDRGPDAWPSCAVNAGLTKDGRAPEVDPGGTSTPLPDPSDDDSDPAPWDRSPSTGSSDTPDGPDDSGAHDGDRENDAEKKSHDGSPDGSRDGSQSGSRDGSSDDARGDAGDEPSQETPAPSESDGRDTSETPEPSDSTTPGDQGDDASPADPSGDADRPDPSGTPGQTSGKGKHRGDADPDEGDGGGRSPGGRHASRGDGGRGTGPAGGDYTVRPGDSLSAIAAAHRLPGGWPALYERNEGVIGTDENLIQPGQRLDLGHKEG